MIENKEKFYQKKIKCKFYRKLQILEDFKTRSERWKIEGNTNDFLKIYLPIYENYERQGNLCQGLTIHHKSHKEVYWEGLKALYNSMIFDLKNHTWNRN